MLSEKELEIFKKYNVGVMKKDFDRKVLSGLWKKKLIVFNMDFIILTRQGKKVWDSVQEKNNLKNFSLSNKKIAKSTESWVE